MSRYSLDMKPGFSDCWAVVGWDRPLNSFFVQVFREGKNEDEDEEEILWRGGSFQEIVTVEQAAALLAPYAAIPSDVFRQLHIDQMANPLR